MMKYLSHSWLLLLSLLTSTAQAQEPSSTTSSIPTAIEEAIFAGGCFWCMEEAFANVPGVLERSSGFCGGEIPNPTYEHHPGYVESVKITYDPRKVTYDQLLSIYWRNIDPFDDRGQFCDKGEAYKAVIFYLNDNQKNKAEESLKKVTELLKRPVATKILPATQYYPAEEYHQHYAMKNPIRYHFYRTTCGRDHRLKEVWQDVPAF
jgi:peptide-methionine (S)-S-oxide reductase